MQILEQKAKKFKAICLEKQVLGQKDAAGFTFGEDRQMFTTEVDKAAIDDYRGVMKSA